MTPQEPIIAFGFCMLCQKEIAPKCAYCGARKPGGAYTEVPVQWSNGSTMMIGVCTECAAKNAHTTEEAKAFITHAHHQHWDHTKMPHDRKVSVV